MEFGKAPAGKIVFTEDFLKHGCPVCGHNPTERVKAGFNGPRPWEIYECRECSCSYRIDYPSLQGGEREIIRTEPWRKFTSIET